MSNLVGSVRSAIDSENAEHEANIGSSSGFNSAAVDLTFGRSVIAYISIV